MSEPANHNRSPAERVGDLETILDEMGAAVREALIRHKRLGNPIAVWRNERVEWIPPEDIPVDEDGASGPKALSAHCTDADLVVSLEDGRALSVPLSWSPRLLHGMPEERARWEMIGGGAGIHWPNLNEDISVSHLLAGRRSGESAASLERWLAARK